MEEKKERKKKKTDKWIEKRGPYQFRARVRKKGFPAQTKTFTTKKDAETWILITRSEMERGTFICSKAAENTTLGEALDRYAKEISADKKGKLQELQRIGKWKQHPLASRSLANLRGVDFAQYRNSRRADGLAANTIRLELAIISHLFTIARKEWGMEGLVNPIGNVRLPSPAPPRERRLEAGEYEILMDRGRKSKSREIIAVVEIAIETAARRSEIVKMRWEHISFAKDKETWHIPDPKNRSPRTVPLSPKAVQVLQSLPRRIDGWVWSVRREQSITQAFSRLCQTRKKDGTVVEHLPGINFHDLRHEATSRLFEMGKFDSMSIATITGHKDLRMLLRYTHLRAENLAAMMR